MEVSEAILQLRPQFVERLELIAAFVQLAKAETYFSTIPKDITNIILELVPDLRTCYLGQYYQIIDKIGDQYEKFLNKYSVSPNSLVYRDHMPSLSLSKLQKDYPYLNFLNRECIHVKIIDDHPIFAGQSQWNPMYQGNDQYILTTLYESIGVTPTNYMVESSMHRSSGTLHPKIAELSNKKLWYTGPSGSFTICILPCGLVFKQIEYSDYTCEQFLCDPTTNTRIAVNHTYTKYGDSGKRIIPIANFRIQFMDDFATVHNPNMNYLKMLKLSQYSSEFAVIQIVENDAEFLEREKYWLQHKYSSILAIVFYTTGSDKIVLWLC